MLDSIVQNDNYYFVESSKMFVRLWLLFLIRESRSFIARRIRQEGVELCFFMISSALLIRSDHVTLYTNLLNVAAGALAGERGGGVG
jgi:hypothetical protein